MVIFIYKDLFMVPIFLDTLVEEKFSFHSGAHDVHSVCKGMATMFETIQLNWVELQKLTFMNFSDALHNKILPKYGYMY